MKRKKLLSFLGIIACLLLAVPASAEHGPEDAWNDRASMKADGKTMNFHITVRSASDHTMSIDVNQTIFSGEIKYDRLDYTCFLYYKEWNGKEWGKEVPILYFGTFDRPCIHDGVEPRVCRDAEQKVPGWGNMEGAMLITKPASDDVTKVGTFKVTNSVLSDYYGTVEWGWKDLSTMYSRENGFMQHCLNYDTEDKGDAYGTSFYMDVDWEMPSNLTGKKLKIGWHRAQYKNKTSGVGYFYEDGTEYAVKNTLFGGLEALSLVNKGILKAVKQVSFEKSEYLDFGEYTRAEEVKDLTLTFSPEPAEYNGIKKVSMSCQVSGVKIYYTTDGSNPTTSSAEYTEPILIEATTTIKAMAVYDKTRGNVQTATYDINPIEYVDFGLPSGTIWSTKNVGANKAEDFGNYYAWGEVETKDSYTDNNYKWGKRNHNTKYQNDNRYRLEVQDDAASMNLGAQWRMPTKAQFEELSSKCNVEWTQLNGVDGYLFVLKGDNSKSIFIPAAGYKWSDNPHCVYLFTTDVQNMKKGYVWRYRADNGGAFSWSSTEYRPMGVPIRPVMNPNQPVTEYLWISGKPDKTKYMVGDKFDVTGLVVNYLPKESSAEKVTEGITWTVEPAVIYSGCTSVTVTASYNGMTSEPVKVAVTTDGMPVDLGLSVQWSSFNIGSATFMGYGDYYPWDENLNKTIESMFGKGWRLPTEAEVKELQDTTKCTWQWFPAGNAENGGVAGYRVISKANNNVIFLPAAGCQSGSNSVGKGSVGNYWTSNAASGSTDAVYMCFDMYDQCTGLDKQSNGRVIRAVKNNE